MADRSHEERRAVAQRQECRGRHVEHQPAVAEEGEGQAIETAEGEAGHRSRDAQAFQGDRPGCVQAEATLAGLDCSFRFGNHLLKNWERNVASESFNEELPAGIPKENTCDVRAIAILNSH